MWFSGIVAIIIAYLLGSIPTAYIVTRLMRGVDIRHLGGGNVGARNVYREVGKLAGIGVGIFDIAKGAGAVFIAWRLLGWPAMVSFQVPTLFVLAAGLAVVSGHIWSIFLRFSGGNGLATTLGILSVIMPVELLIVIGITIVLLVITHNPVLSVNISLFSVFVSVWFLGGQIELHIALFIFSIILGAILLLHFMPVAREALVNAENRENLINELLRGNKEKK